MSTNRCTPLFRRWTACYAFIMARCKRSLDLFGGLEASGRPVDPRAAGMKVEPRSGARLLVPQRQQIVLLPLVLDEAVPAAHVVRAIWKVVESMNCDKLYARVGSRKGTAGAPAIDPRLMIALWVAGVAAGINSAGTTQNNRLMNALLSAATV